MAFPTIVSDNGDTFGNNTSHTISWGASPQSGDLLFVLIGHDNYLVTCTWDNLSFSQPLEFQVIATSQERARLFVHICDGTEGSSDTVTLSGSESLAYTSILVRDWGWFVASKPDANVGGSDPPSSPELTSPQGVKDILWLAFAAMRDSGTWSSAPTGYNLANQLIEGVGSSSATIDVAMAGKNATSASETPGAWGSSGGAGFGITVAIGPKSAGGGVRIPNIRGGADQ